MAEVLWIAANRANWTRRSVKKGAVATKRRQVATEDQGCLGRGLGNGMGDGCITALCA
jgi:hypothetical protein